MPGKKAFPEPLSAHGSSAVGCPTTAPRGEAVVRAGRPLYTLRMPPRTIAHLSDIHCGGGHFVPDLMERAIMEINELEPDVVICSGDLTSFGFRPEYAEAKAYLDKLACAELVVVPGNHDSRNVGYIHFEELFGDRNRVVHLNGVSIVAVDSTEPDLDHGHIGRNRYRWIQEQFSQDADFRIF